MDKRKALRLIVVALAFGLVMPVLVHDIVFPILGNREVPADPKGEGTQGDLARIKGHWRIVSIEQEGWKLDRDGRSPKDVVVFDGDRAFTVANGVAADGPHQFHIDPDRRPKWINIGGRGQRGVEGLYEFQGNRLVICWELLGKNRPPEIKAKGAAYVFTFEKVAPVEFGWPPLEDPL